MGKKSEGFVTPELNWEGWCDVAEPAVRREAALLCAATRQGGMEGVKQ